MKLRTIGAHWYSRRENLKVCTETLLSFLQNLELIDKESFGKWYEKGYSKEASLQKQVLIKYSSIKKLLSKSGEDTDFPKISFDLSIWNGKFNENKASDLTVSLGSDEEKFFTNNCVINLSVDNEMENEKLLMLIELLDDSWKPEWIMIDDKKIVSPYKDMIV